MNRIGSATKDAGHSHKALVDTSKLSPGKHTPTPSTRSYFGENAVQATVTILAAEALRDVGDRKQLFIDNRFNESIRNVKLHITPPAQMRPKFTGSNYPHNIVYLEDQGVWRKHFVSMVTNLQHADSQDGINWKRFGSRKINYESDREPGKLVLLSFGAVVILDPQDTPEHWFKAFVGVCKHSRAGDRYEIKRNLGDESKCSQAGVHAFLAGDRLRCKKSGRVPPVSLDFVSFVPQ